MPSLFPCPEFQRDCDCSNFPVQNFSQEAPDQNHCFSNYTAPPVAGTFFAPSCFVQCTEVIVGTAEECAITVEECAARAGVDCVGNPPVVPPGTPPNGPFFPGRVVYQNSFQSCTVTCPDGTTFTDSVPAGTIHSLWQADADARAYALACKRANAKRVCFITDATLDSICANVAGTVTFDVFGGTAPYTYAHTGGTLPTGMSFDGNGTLFGTPTTGGSYTFEVTATDAVGSTQIKEFTIKIVQITSPTALPNATQNASYNYTLLTAGTTAPTSWVHVSGAFPAGLLLDLATGVLSSDIGGITESGDFSFTLRIKDGSGVECDKAFTLHVTPAQAILGYWTFDNITGGPFNKTVHDSSPNALNLSSDICNSVVGKVANAGEIDNTAIFNAFAPNPAFFTTPSQGFTVAGWMKLVPDGGVHGNLWLLNFGAYYVTLELVNSNDLQVRHNLLGIAIATPAPVDGNWHFFRMWYDGTNLNLQLDNGAILQGAMAITDNSLSDIQMAGNSSWITAGGRTFDETGFWPRALSNAEGTQLWNGGVGVTWPAVPP